MFTRSIVIAVLLTALFILNPAMAAPPGEPFVPDHVAVEDVRIALPSSRGALTVINAGTKVQVTKVDGDQVLVRTERGVQGRAKRSAFSRLIRQQFTVESKAVAAANNAFAFDLFQHLRKDTGNQFFSPASISTALAMTYAGAAGDTAREMAAVLHLPVKTNPHDGFVKLLTLLNSSSEAGGYTLSTANRLWGANDYKFEQDFLTLTREKYLAELSTLDFQKPETARRTINAWVEEQTHKKIVDLIPAGVIDQDTRLVLTNAVYFKSGWSEPFRSGDTKPARFTLTDGTHTEAPTMRLLAGLPYTEDGDVQVLALPYRGYELSMIVVVPKKADGLPALEKALTEKQYFAWVASVRDDTLVDVHLPKFKMRSQFALSNALAPLGMQTAFSNEADFSKMARAEPLKISAVVHQAFVDVDEKGTEATAATAVDVAVAAAPGEPMAPPKPIVFRADHPFLFFIRENRTGAVLFMGRMEKPD